MDIHNNSQFFPRFFARPSLVLRGACPPDNDALLRWASRVSSLDGLSCHQERVEVLAELQIAARSASSAQLVLHPSEVLRIRAELCASWSLVGQSRRPQSRQRVRRPTEVAVPRTSIWTGCSRDSPWRAPAAIPSAASLLRSRSSAAWNSELIRDPGVRLALGAPSTPAGARPDSDAPVVAGGEE